MVFTETDEIIGDYKLVKKWAELRHKEIVLINVSDIVLREGVHKTKYVPRLPDNVDHVFGTIIVRPDITEEGQIDETKYALVRGWRLYKWAQSIGQEKIEAYITHTGRKKFAQKLLKIKNDMENDNVK